MADAFGSDGTPPRGSDFANVDWVSCDLDVMDIGGAFVDGEITLVKLVFELFLRSINGIDGLFPPLVALELLLEDRLSKRFLMSGGMGTEWTTLTECQSAAWMYRCSLGLGGRQHPGHPGF
jgi:hypothetical protein